ncbi:MAG TPA: CBS domain-containing protein [Myxococcaceae bacterium]|nr:CBS domain-containing protein [Myxococcaceae bacterium]
MADRRTDNGRDEQRAGQQRPSGATALPGGTDMMPRTADVAPPGSRERSESDLTGYSPMRDEDPAARQGRFHRAAQMRMAQPRTSSDMGIGMGPGMGMGAGHNADTGRDERGGFGMTRWGQSTTGDRGEMARGLGSGWDSRGGSDVRDLAYGGGKQQQGPYGTDDRDDRYASGHGPSPRMGEHDTRHSLDMRRDSGDNYRPWDRTGYGRDEREERAQASRERWDPLLGMGHASSGQPGTGVNMGQGGTFTARPRDTATQGSTNTQGGLGTQGTTGRRRWQREPLTAREIMTRNIKTVRRESTLREVAQLMKDEDCGVVPIVDERGCLVGIVTDRDLVIRAFTGGKSPDQLRAGDVMTDDVECVHPEESIHSVIEMMGRRQIRRVPVVERDDRVIGIISMGDIANRADYDEELQEALDRVSSKRSFWSRLT